uniref:Tetraspanin n=1 Tax=Kryptolebias marmoratus TaxID=37003 RepID=A0A3Q3AKN9_KRYMA
MGKVNICLKRTYISVISLIGVSISLFSVFSPQVEVNPTLDFNYVFCTINLIIVIIGGYGVLKEIKWALIAFAVGATLIFLFLLGRGNANSKTVTEMEQRCFNILPPLIYYEFSSLSTFQFQCCGVESYRDWENNIPESCVCDDESTNPCVIVQPVLYL